MTKEYLFSEIYPISDYSLKASLVNATEIRKAEKNTYLCHQGEDISTVYFLNYGIVSIHVIDKDGNIQCVDIINCPGDILTGYFSSYGVSSSFDIKMETKGEVFAVRKKDFQKILMNNPGVEFNNSLWGRLNKRRLDFVHMLYLCKATERYEWFIQRYPGVIERINHKIIASFLRMSPITLSRITSDSGNCS
jgi:CRP-like cAMP-binding protein